MSMTGSSSPWSYASFATVYATNHVTQPQRISRPSSETISTLSRRAWMLPTLRSLGAIRLLPQITEPAHRANDDAGGLELRA